MEPLIKFVRIRSREETSWPKVWEIYRQAFPENEQWNEAAYDKAFDDPLFEADAVTLDGAVVGLLFHWQVGMYRYIEHFAVAAEMRGRNIGSQTLAAFFAYAGERVVLEIDPPEEAVPIRRLHFYERAGFVANPDYEYLHPCYRPPFEPYPLVLLSRPQALAREEARRFADFVRERILSRYSENEHPELPVIS